MTATSAAVVASYRTRTPFAAAETRAVQVPRLLRGLLRAATHVAEVPCGAGHFLPAYVEHEVVVTLVDACQDMLDLAADRAADHGLPSDRVTARRALVQDLELPSGVDLVVLPNAALNQLAAQSGLPTLLAAVRATIGEGTVVLAQVCCEHPAGAVDASTFYDDRRPHGQWFPDTVLPCDQLDGDVLRRRRQHRDRDQLRIEFDYLDKSRTRVESAVVDLRVFTAEELISAFGVAGFTDVRFLPGTDGLSEITALAGPGATS